MDRSTLPLIASACSLFFFPLVFAAENPIRDIHELTMQWTGLEHQKDELESNWRIDKPILEQQLTLLNRERDDLNSLLEESRQEQGEVEEQRLELLSLQTSLEQEQALVSRELEQATLRLKGLYQQLPSPLMKSWELDITRLEDPLLTTSERVQTVLELLGQLDDFEQKVTLNETVMTLENGEDYLVKQVYLGLSQGWYVTADLSFAASGTATPNGWQWSPISDGAPVAAIIGILERRMSAEMVSIPLIMNTDSVGGN